MKCMCHSGLSPFEADENHSSIWEKMKDRFFFNLLNVALNQIPTAKKRFASMEEK